MGLLTKLATVATTASSSTINYLFNDVKGDGSQLAPVHNLLDSTGALIDPAKQGTDPANPPFANAGTGLSGWLATIAGQTEATRAAIAALTDLGEVLLTDGTKFYLERDVAPAGGGAAVTTYIDITTGQAANPQPAAATLFPPTKGQATAALQTAIVAALGTPFQAGGALGAGEAHLGAIGGEGAHPLASPAATALAYATGKCIGGPTPLPGFIRSAGRSALIQSLTLRSLDVISAPIDVYIFRGLPTNLAGLADGATFAVAAADVPLVSRRYSFTAYDSLGAAVISTLDGVGKYMGLATGTTAYLQAVARGAVTFTNAANLSVSVGVSQD